MQPAPIGKAAEVGLVLEPAHELEPRLARRARLKIESVVEEVAVAVGTATNEAGAPLAGRGKGPGLSGRDGPDRRLPAPPTGLEFRVRSYPAWRPSAPPGAATVAIRELSGRFATPGPSPSSVRNELSSETLHKQDVGSIGQIGEETMRRAACVNSLARPRQFVAMLRGPLLRDGGRRSGLAGFFCSWRRPDFAGLTAQDEIAWICAAAFRRALLGGRLRHDRERGA